MRWEALSLVLMTPLVLFARERIAFIEFFGYQGLDVGAIRKALPFREGDVLRKGIEDEARSSVQRTTGRSPTDVAVICCAGGGNWAIFIGLPGTSSHPMTFHPAPQGVITPPAELTELHGEMDRAERDAVHKKLTETDDSFAAGYRLINEPAARAAELALHEYAIKHEAEILAVLTESADASQRAMAVDALGFGARTPRQTAALLRAVRDSDAEVRNNATRAIVEILRAEPFATSQIPPDDFIEMLRSGTWTDRNKGSFLLQFLTASRDPVLLSRIQSEAGDELLEMASWRPIGWAIPAHMIRARIEGKSDASAMLGGLPLSVRQGALVAALVSGLLAFAFVRFTSRGGGWAFGLLTPALISTLLYSGLLRFVGLSFSAWGILAFWFILPWYAAAAVASCCAVVLKWGWPFHA